MFWNWTYKNIPDWQQCAHFPKSPNSAKSLHPTVQYLCRHLSRLCEARLPSWSGWPSPPPPDPRARRLVSPVPVVTRLSTVLLVPYTHTYDAKNAFRAYEFVFIKIETESRDTLPLHNMKWITKRIQIKKIDLWKSSPCCRRIAGMVAVTGASIAIGSEPADAWTSCNDSQKNYLLKILVLNSESQAWILWKYYCDILFYTPKTIFFLLYHFCATNLS